MEPDPGSFSIHLWIYFCLAFLLIPLFMNLIRLTLIVFRGPRGNQDIAHQIYEERAKSAILELIITCMVLLTIFILIVITF